MKLDGNTPSPQAPHVAPVCPKKPHSTEKFGHRWEDPYFWLREKDNPEVRAYVESENLYAKSVMEPLKGLQTQIFDELKARLEPVEKGVPSRRGDYEYSYEIPDGAQYSVYLRRRVTAGAAAEVILDTNALARGHSYFALRTFKVSPDHRLLAYATDTDGSEHCTIRVKNLLTEELLAEEITHASGSLAWSLDSKHLYYVKRAANDRPFQVWLHEIGTSSNQDQLLFDEPDAKFFVGVSASKDEKFIFVTSNAKITSELWVIDPSRSLTTLNLIHRRTHGVEISDVEHWGTSFLLLTNDQEQNFRLVETPEVAPSLSNSTDVLRGDRNIYLQHLEVTKDFWILQERQLGLSRIRVLNARTREHFFIEQGEPTYALFSVGSSEFGSSELRYSFSSPKTSLKIYDYNLKTRERVLKKDTQIGGGFDSAFYLTERIMVTSHDGTQVPVSLLYRKDLDRSRPAPVLLYGYGSYGHAMDAGMGTGCFSLVDRGFIWAIAHIRGGSDLGRWWYEDGKFLKKKNTFYDFIAAADGLIKLGYTQKGLISIQGGSAGGMLVGASMNMRPDLFKCVVGDVPFVDVVNTMLDDTLMLTVLEYDEWGNPNVQEFFEYIRSYSPYDNLKEGEYPHVFLMAGWNDPRVTYWEPAKFAARLRDVRLDSRKTLLHTNMGAGHGGVSGRFGRLEEQAMHFAFILSCYDSANS